MKEKVIENFGKEKGFIKTNNFKIIELDEEHCKMEYKIEESGLNPVKIVHGGVLFGLADTCAGALACMTGKFPLTTSSNINYLSQAKGDKLYAIANILKVGHNIGYYIVDIFDDTNKKVANATVNMYFTDYK